MSWSIGAVGRPAAVAKSVTESAARQKCAEPEETFKAKVSEIIAEALKAFPPNHPVSVDASGSQSPGPTGVVNSLTLSIKPLWGFLE